MTPACHIRCSPTAGCWSWNFFASSLRFAVTSLTSNANLVTKVYFPARDLSLLGGARLARRFGGRAHRAGRADGSDYRVAPRPAILLLPVVLVVARHLHGRRSRCSSRWRISSIATSSTSSRSSLTVWMFATSVLYPVERSRRPARRGAAAESDDADHRRLSATCCSAAAAARAGFLGVAAVVGRSSLLAGVGVVPPRRIRVRGEHLMAEPAVVFDGVWKKFRRGERHDSLRDLIPALVRRLARPPRTPSSTASEFWALQDVSFEVSAGRGARHHRPERRRQIHHAEAADADPAGRPAARRACDGRVGALIEVAAGLPSGSDRPRERLPAGRDHGHATRARSAGSSTRSSSSPASPISSIRR